MYLLLIGQCTVLQQLKIPSVQYNTIIPSVQYDTIYPYSTIQSTGNTSPTQGSHSCDPGAAPLFSTLDNSITGVFFEKARERRAPNARQTLPVGLPIKKMLGVVTGCGEPVLKRDLPCVGKQQAALATMQTCQLCFTMCSGGGGGYKRHMEFRHPDH